MKNRYEIRGDIAIVFVKYKNVIYETVIDINKLEEVKKHPNTWYANKNTGGQMYVNGALYAPRKQIKLHRLITNAENGYDVDHINHDTLDNRVENLRVVTRSGNIQNINVRKDSNSGIQNVTWNKKREKWLVRIRKDGKCLFQEWYSDIEEAKKAAALARHKYLPYSLERRSLESDESIDVSYNDKTLPYKKNKSGERNVYWCESKKKWIVTVRKNKKVVHLSSHLIFEDAVETARSVRNKLTDYM